MKHFFRKIKTVGMFGILILLPAQAHKGASSINPDEVRNQVIQALNANNAKLDLEVVGGLDNDWKPAEPLNQIDEFTFKKMQDDGVPLNEVCDDSTFIRRVSLLLTGKLPDPDQTRAFLAETAVNKRAMLIDSILESEAFNTYWSFWFQEYFGSTGRLLRNGLPFYNVYLEDSVRTAKPLDVMARELVTSTGLTDEVGPANFFARSNEMVRLPQDFWDNIAGHVGEKFLGISLGCISCHDGANHLENINLFLTDKKREDLWAMAAFFSGISRRPGTRQENLILSLNIIETRNRGYLAVTDTGDRPIRDGGTITPRFLLTDESPRDDQNYLQAAAEMITSDRQFARNWANRFWGHLFGLAMVEPMNSFDLYRIDPNRELPEGWTHQALDLNLLEHMTDKLIEFKFDLRAYLRYVANSATFQLSATYKPGNWQETYAPYYARFLARRLPAESVYDSLVAASGVQIPLYQRNRYQLDEIESVPYAHMLHDTNQPRGRGQQDIANFLNAFGRGNRFDLPRTGNGDIGQALMLMNSTITNGRLLTEQNRLFRYVESDLDAAGITRELYLDFLCREPTSAEVTTLLTELARYETPQEQAVTIQWLLINKLDFLFIY